MNEQTLSMTRRQLLEWPMTMPPLDVILSEFMEHVERIGGPLRWITTSIYRTPAEDAALSGSGVHTAFRAIDIISHPWRQGIADHAAAATNAEWVYDPKRDDLRCVLSAAHGTGAHAHIQVHPNTRRRRIE